MERKYLADDELPEMIANSDKYEISDKESVTGDNVEKQIEISEELEM